MDEKPQPEEHDWRFAPPEETDTDAAESSPAEPDALPAAEMIDLDIDAALAAVSTLDDMLAAEEAAEQERQERERIQAELRQQREQRLQNPEAFFPMPPFTTLQRGSLDSVVPALLLIGIGAWLTFTLTTTQTAPDPFLLALVICGGLGVMLLVRWLASGRWAAGTLFFALLLALVGGGGAFLLTAGLLVTGWPLLIAAGGVALLLADQRAFFPGLLLILSGAVAYAATAGIIPSALLTTFAALWPVVLAVIGVLLLLTLFRRRQRA